MKIEVSPLDITNSKEDALVYSTNKSLLLSGGVGQALVNRYGQQVQNRLFKHAQSADKPNVQVGDVFVSKEAQLPWQIVVHTVVTDEEYNTSLDVLKAVLAEALEVCDNSYGVFSIAMSALGCGYGDCSHKDFIKLLRIVSTEYNDSDLQRIVVYCKQPDFYQQLKDALEMSD